MTKSITTQQHSLVTRAYIPRSWGGAYRFSSRSIFSNAGMEIKPLAEIFVRLIKTVNGPIVFITIVTGISGAAHGPKNYA